MSNEHYALEAEVSELQGMLATLPPDEVITKMGLEARLESAIANLKALGTAPSPNEKLLLTFRGQPVDGTRGIVADFGGKALDAFSSAVGTILASINGELAERGPVPKRNDNQLMITGTATGSFGFELEVPGKSIVLFDDEVGVGDVVQAIQNLLETTVTGTDDDLTEVVDMIHPRAVKKVSEFLGYLESNQASFGLSFKGRSFKFQNTAQLSSSALKLKDQNLHEDFPSFEGYFVGILPHSRMFEFKIKESEEIIKGKIGSKQIDPNTLSEDFLKVPVSAEFRAVRVGDGKPKYSLMKIEDVSRLGNDKG